MIKKIILIFILLFMFSFSVNAEEKTDFYSEQYEFSGTENIKNALPEDTREFLNQNGLNPENKNWVESITYGNVFTHIFSFLKTGIKAPLLSSISAVAIILISAAISTNSLSFSATKASLYATCISAAAVVCIPVFSVVEASVNAMKGCCVFMTSFVPVFAVISASSGIPATAVSAGALLLGASQVVNYISNFAVMPLMSGYMALSIASSVSPVLNKSGIAEGIKKIVFWIMSLLTTVFVGVLSIQTAVNSSADTLTVKTAKFIIGSSVPVAGMALSEALTTVTASMGLLKSSIGIYGVVACICIFLPLLAELLLWRIALNITSAIGDLFSVPSISGLLRSLDSVLSVLTGIILLTLAMFVISLAIVITAGKKV